MAEERKLSCYDVLNGLPVVELRAPLSLYHMTFRNTKYVRQDLLENGDVDELSIYENLSRLPEGGILQDLEHPKYFSLQRMHPLYYTPKGYEVHRGYLRYVTTRPLRLFDGRTYNKLEINAIIRCIEDREIRNLNTCIDGWVIQDDPADTYYEILLTHPKGIVALAEEIIYSPEEKQKLARDEKAVGKFPYGAEDVLTIARSETKRGILRVLSNDTCEVIFNRASGAPVVSKEDNFEYATVLPYAVNPDTNKLVFLVGRESEMKGWSGSRLIGDFGGARDFDDENGNPIPSETRRQTAARECYEELLSFLGTEEEIYEKLAEAEEFYNPTGSTFLWRVAYMPWLPLAFRRVYDYFAKCASVNEFGMRIIKSCPEGFYEKTEVMWLTAGELLARDDLRPEFRRTFETILTTLNK